jgi:hypothetical protein
VVICAENGDDEKKSAGIIDEISIFLQLRIKSQINYQFTNLLHLFSMENLEIMIITHN